MGTSNGRFDSPIVEDWFMAHIGSKLLSKITLLLILAVSAQAQTASYHLHKEASATTGLFQLKTAGPDGTSLALPSANLKGVAAGEYLIKAFDTPSGVPNTSGTIPVGSNISFTLWMRKTTTGGTIYPRAKLRLNSATGTLLGTATSATALTSTLTKYTFTATTSASITMSATDRFYVWVGVNLTAAPTTNTTAELDIEGTLNGNYDSLVTVPLPARPTINSISPTVGPAGTNVTLSGSNFGSTQGTSTITFNGVNASPTNWSTDTIIVPVPSGATTGPVFVTVNGATSNSQTFTIGDVSTITGTVSRTLDGAPIFGAQVKAIQSGVVKGTTTSGSNGAYSLTNLLAGTYDVQASASGHDTQTQTGQQITPQSPNTINFALNTTHITYIYDELGRLVGAVDPSGDTARYTYDAVGNLTSISRHISSQISIIEFSPNNGAPGTPVTIYGTGFSRTPGQNTVKFNGVAATVASSTTTQIVTSVPNGATTGPITVATSAGTATSSTAFTVGNATAPTITNFTPNVGAPGASVTLTGTNFQAAPSNNKVAFNGVRAPVISATATSIVTAVPNGAASGRLTVTTPDGKAVSASDFYIAPPPYTGADVESTGRIAIGETKAVSVNTANKVAMLLFDGVAGQRISLNIPGSTITNYAHVYIYRLDNTQLTNTYVYQNGTGFIDALALPATGTYTIIIDPEGANTGSMTLQLNDATDSNVGTITPGGPPVTTTTTTTGQNARATFSGTAGQKVSLDVSSVNIPGTHVSIQNPNGTTLASIYSGTAGAFMDTQTLPVSGIYTILVDPSNTNTGSATLRLYDVPANGNAPIVPGGSPVTIATTVPGQNAALSFNGTAGQHISLSLSGVTIPNYSYIYLLRPDGAQVTSTYVNQNTTAFIDTLPLPVSGTYIILVDPQGPSIGNMSVQLNNASNVPAGTITAGGAPVTVSVTTAGQTASLTFNGYANQRISLGMGNGTMGWALVSIVKPDGTNLIDPTWTNGGGYFDVRVLPATGTYTIIVDPENANTGNLTLQLYNVPPDPISTIMVGGPSVSVSTTTPGQNPKLTFSGNANQRISLGMGNGTMGWALVSIINPDGTYFINPSWTNGGGYFDVRALPATGTYTIVVDPENANTGSMSFTLFEVLPDSTSTIVVGGPSVNVLTTTPGQNARLTFNGNANQRISLGMGNGTMGWALVSIIKPDGSFFISPTWTNGGGYFDVRALPATGTYTIIVDPENGNTGSMSFTLFEVLPDSISTIVAGGSAVSISTTTPGQNARLTFNGNANQRISLGMGNGTMGWALVSIVKPDGTNLIDPTWTNGGGYFDVRVLPATGTYTIIVDPENGNTGSMSFSLFDVPPDVTDIITPGGSSVTVSTTTPGQNARLTFSGSANQQISLNMGNGTMGWALVSIIKPDGTNLIDPSWTNGGGSFGATTLPATGTYTILVDPEHGNTGSLTLTLNNVVP
jgi:YD repeat-containing protein